MKKSNSKIVRRADTPRPKDTATTLADVVRALDGTTRKLKVLTEKINLMLEGVSALQPTPPNTRNDRMSVFNAEITAGQRVQVGARILDTRNPPKPLTTLPSGVTVSITADKPDIGVVEMWPDGMNAWVKAGNVGLTTVTVHIDGMPLGTVPDDTVEVDVISRPRPGNPGSVSTYVGEPVDQE